MRGPSCPGRREAARVLYGGHMRLQHAFVNVQNLELVGSPFGESYYWRVCVWAVGVLRCSDRRMAVGVEGV